MWEGVILNSTSVQGGTLMVSTRPRGYLFSCNIVGFVLSSTFGPYDGFSAVISSFYTESQHDGGWKGPLEITQSSPLPKQGHPEQAAQDCFQTGFEYLWRRRLHSPSGQPGPGFCHPQSKEVLPHVQMELPLLQFQLLWTVEVCH